MENFIKNFAPPNLAKDSYLLSFEGIEGSGKSTQINRIADFLNTLGYSVKVVREPGGTVFGEKLREAMLGSEVKIHPLAEAYLFASARTELLYEVTLPFLSQSKHVVIYDRYIDSSIAYQGTAGSLGISNVLKIHSLPPLVDALPHLTFYLDIPLELSFERQAKRNQKRDYFESKGEEFYRKLIEGYEEALKLFPKRIKRVDATLSEDKVTEAITKLVNEFLTR